MLKRGWGKRGWGKRGWGKRGWGKRGDESNICEQLSDDALYYVQKVLEVGLLCL